MKKLITVSQKHIDIGARKSSRHCPIALAFSGQYPGVSVYVSWGTIRVSKWGWRQKLPIRAERFISKLDNQGKKAVKPFRFWLEIP